MPTQSAVVLASYLPSEGHFESDRFEVVGIECWDEFDYWVGVAAWWDSDRTLVLVEHDIQVSDEHITELLACPHPLDSWAYRCHWISTGVAGGVIAAGTGERGTDWHPAPGFLTGGEEWAAWSAIGLVKIAPEARIGRVLRRETWNRLELAVHDAVKRPWHMHGNAVGGAQLVPHFHW